MYLYCIYILLIYMYNIYMLYYQRSATVIENVTALHIIAYEMSQNDNF
jgi:hypothetical protein